MSPPSSIRLLALLPFILLLSGCGEEGPSTAPSGAAPSLLRVAGGDGQHGVAGAALGEEIAVVVADASGKGIPGFVVRFAVVSGGGQVGTQTVASDARGVARTTWTLGAVAADSQVVEARADGVPSVRMRATARPDAPATVAVIAGNGAAGQLGVALADSLAVTVRDRHGNPVVGLEVAWTVAAGGGSVSPARTVTGPGGVARTRWTLGLRVDSAHVALARVAGLDSVAFTANAVTTGVQLRLAKRGGDEQRGAAGTVLADSLAVSLWMPDGRPVAGALVTWSVPPQSGVVAPLATRTDANGAAATVWRLGTTPGVVQATATVDEGTLVFNAVVGADAPAAVAAVAGGGEGPVGGALADSLAVRVTDRFGNPVAGAEVDWSAQAGSGSVHPARSATDAQGIARARWTLGLRVGSPGQTASATLAGLPPVSFQATAVTRGVPLQLARTGGGDQEGEVGTALADSLTVQLHTQAGEPVEGATVSWAVVSGGGAVSPATARTDAQGRARAAWTLGTGAGAQQASAQVDEGALAFDATARPGAPAALAIAGGAGQSSTRGTVLPAPLAVRVTDRYGNAVLDAPVRWRVAAGEGRVEADETRTDANGTARVRWALGTRLLTQRAAASVTGLDDVRFSATPLPGALVFRAVSDTMAHTTYTERERVVDDTLKVSLFTTDGRPAVGAAVEWDSHAGAIGLITYTDWQGIARVHWYARMSDVQPAIRTVRSEDEQIRFISPWRPSYSVYADVLGFSFFVGDTARVVLYASEQYGDGVLPPEMRVRFRDETGWSIVAEPGDTILWPLNRISEALLYEACVADTEYDDPQYSCWDSWIEVRPRPSAAAEQAAAGAGLAMRPDDPPGTRRVVQRPVLSTRSGR